MVPRLGLGAFTAGGLGSIPGQGTKIPQAQATQHGQNKTKQNPKYVTSDSKRHFADVIKLRVLRWGDGPG